MVAHDPVDEGKTILAVHRAIAQVGGVTTFNRLKRELDPSYQAVMISLAITVLEEEGQIAVLVGPKQEVYYIMESVLERGR